jgi:ankyrin repeat protein
MAKDLFSIPVINMNGNSKGEQRAANQALHYNIIHYGALAIEESIRSGADLNNSDRYGHRPLDQAVSRGKDDVVAALIKGGAIINVRGNKLTSPIYCAVCRPGRASVLRLLIEGGGNVNRPFTTGNYPLHVAAEFSDIETVDLLVASKAKLTTRNKKGLTPFQVALQNKDPAMGAHFMSHYGECFIEALAC